MTAGDGIEREQRTVFGEAPELYDRARAGYPKALVEDVLSHRRLPDLPALEVGAGTGKATVAFAARGLEILALEPSTAMAEVAARNCGAFPGVTIRVTTFEDWPLETNSFGLVFSAQAWHWVDPSIRWRRAADALAPGGSLALFWHRPAWQGEELRDKLDEVYRRRAPDLLAKNPGFPGLLPPAHSDEIFDEIAGTGLFGDVETRSYPWSASFTADSFVDLLLSQSDHRLYPERQREQLLESVRALIQDEGGTVTVPHSTLLILTRSRPA